MNIFEKIEVLKEEYLFFKYLFLDFSDYSNLAISFPVGLVLFFAAIALPLCVFFISYKEATVAKIAVQLLRHEATSEERAETLSKLRLNEKKYKKALSGTGKLAGIVARAGFSKPSYEEFVQDSKKKKPTITLDIDFESECFYILPEQLDAAKKLAESDRSTVLKPIILSLGIVVLIGLLFIFMPELLEAMNNWIGK
jgi:hypothetical protein